MFRHKISTWVVCLHGKHPGSCTHTQCNLSFGTPPFKGHKIWSWKNTLIIFVSITSIEGTPLFRGKGHFSPLKPGFNNNNNNNNNNGSEVAHPQSGSSSTWFLIEAKFGMLVFEERGKPVYPEKNLSEQRREPTTNSTHIWHRRRYLNPGHIGGRRVLSPLHYPLLPKPSFKRHLLFSKCDWSQKGLTCLSSHWLQLRKRSLTELSHLNRCTTFVNSTYNIAEIIKLMIIFYVVFVG